MEKMIEITKTNNQSQLANIENIKKKTLRESLKEIHQNPKLPNKNQKNNLIKVIKMGKR